MRLHTHGTPQALSGASSPLSQQVSSTLVRVAWLAQGAHLVGGGPRRAKLKHIPSAVRLYLWGAAAAQAQRGGACPDGDGLACRRQGRWTDAVVLVKRKSIFEQKSFPDAVAVVALPAEALDGAVVEWLTGVLVRIEREPFLSALVLRVQCATAQDSAEARGGSSAAVCAALQRLHGRQGLIVGCDGARMYVVPTAATLRQTWARSDTG
jgi:hypothetical protein